MTASAVVSENVRALRARRRWSVRKLAERCAELGLLSLTENALENIERDRSNSIRPGRPVTVDELLALAHALEVTPADLLAGAVP